MQVANIRNISISFCLGIFSFHMYMVSTYDTNYLQSSISKASYRSIAAEPVTCAFSTLSIESFTSSSHSPSNCEKILTLKVIPETKDVAIRLYAKLGKNYLVHPASGEDMILVSGVETGDETIATLSQIPEVKMQAQGILDDKLPSLIEQLSAVSKDAVVSSDNSVTTVEESSFILASTDDVAANTSSFNEVSFVINTDDKDKIKEIFLKTDRFTKENNRCLLSANGVEILGEVRGELKEVFDIDREIKSFKSNIRNQEIKNLSQEKVEQILDLDESLSEINGERNSSNSAAAKLSCFSKRAMKGTADEQYISYMKNIRPFLAGALDGSNSSEDSAMLLNAINTDSSFENLRNSNENIKSMFQVENLAASTVLACSSQADRTLCTQGIKADIAKLEAVQAQDHSNVILNDSIVIYKEWLSKLTVANEVIEGESAIDKILGNTDHKLSVEPVVSTGGQVKLLEAAKRANERLRNMVKEPQRGASARSRVITPYQGAIPMLDDQVIYNESRSLK